MFFVVYFTSKAQRKLKAPLKYPNRPDLKWPAKLVGSQASILHTSYSSYIYYKCFVFLQSLLVSHNQEQKPPPNLCKHLLWNRRSRPTVSSYSMNTKGPGNDAGQLTCPPPAHPAASLMRQIHVPRRSTNSTENHSDHRLSVYWLEHST